MVTDLRFCTANMAMQAVSMSASLTQAHRNLPLPFRRAMAMTTVFKFCQRPATLNDDPHDTYSRHARLLLNLLQQKNLLRDVPPSDMIGLKCGYCFNNDNMHFPGCISFIALGKHYKRSQCGGHIYVSLQQRVQHVCKCASAGRNNYFVELLQQLCHACSDPAARAL
ncbi:MAG: hypothetical protein SGARI_003992, partial [Bacillariaceae sp.]